MSNIYPLSIEIFSDDLNGWISLSLNEFGYLVERSGLYTNDKECDINAILSGRVSYKISLQEESSKKVDLNWLTVGDYVEYQNSFPCELLLSYQNEHLKIQIDETKSTSIVTMWIRSKVIAVDQWTALLQSNDKLYKEDDLSKIRLLTDDTYEGNLKNKKFILKKLDFNFFASKNSAFEGQSEKINLYRAFQLISPETLESKNIFFQFTNDNEMILFCNNKSIIFIQEILEIKLNESLKMTLYEEEIKKESYNLAKLNNILESSTKEVFKFHKKFLYSIQNTILKFNSFKEDISYLTVNREHEPEYFSLIIYSLDPCRLKEGAQMIKLKEDFIKIDQSLKEWIEMLENQEEMNKIVAKSKIVDFFIDEKKEENNFSFLFLLGEEKSLNDFKKLWQIMVKYFDKIEKTKKEAEGIQKEIISLQSELTQIKRK